MAAGKIQAYYVVSTHWDREWYEAFQQFRYHLVELLDEVLDLMAADERFVCFQTDGQSIILEDYLEIRPERAEQVHAYAKAGRLRVGPWYTMPDENIVAPESLVRNLEEGIRVARDFGNISKAGFVCDIFGHVSQLPQIFHGFGIDNAFLFRGVNEDTHRGSFRWTGADGSELVVMRFGPKEGYFDLAAAVRGGFDQENEFELEAGIERLVEYVDVQRDRIGTDAVLLFDGGDHMPIEPQTIALLEGLKKKRPDVELHFTGLDEYAAALRERKDQITRTDQGELRAPGKKVGEGAWVIPGVLSSRVQLKQANRACETLLCWWAEPFSMLATAKTGAADHDSYIRRAWRYVLENHAHDSICGCSPDQIHKDMEFRFDQAKLISGKVIDNALTAIAARIDLPELEGEQYALVVFNPSQQAIDGPVDLELWFDENTKNLFNEFFAFEPKVGFRLCDADGNEIPYDRVSYKPQRRRFKRAPRRAPRGQECIVVQVTAPLKVPAFGYTTLTIKPEDRPTRHPQGGIVTSHRSLENEHLRVEVNANGSVALHDKRNKQTYDNLLVFEDRADIGDGWYHGIAVNDEIYSTAATQAEVAVVFDGTQKGVLRIVQRMQVPKRFYFEKQMRRTEEKAELRITTEVTLRRGADNLECRTTIDNTVRDHRVRVLCETGVDAKTYWADSAFDVVEREIALPADNHLWKELAVETRPQTSWAAIADAKRGLAIVAPDLCESCVRDVPGKPLALTLLRGFRRTVFTDGEEGGQIIGTHAFNYRLVPFAGEPNRVSLAVLGQQMNAGLRTIERLARDKQADGAPLPRTAGQLFMSPGNAVMTSFRKYPEHGYVEVRIFNPYDDTHRETLRFEGGIVEAFTTDLEGNKTGKLAHKQDEVTVELGPKKIVTVGVTMRA
ncbi:MAG: glycoside hydrolase family 38 [Phycisphaerales bacterium]|nr:glycoside hydrolase family 38 [Phycisphaerales bacterium]